MFAIYLFAILAIASNTSAWISVEEHNPNLVYTSHCYGESYKIGELEKGQTKRIEKVCAEAECMADRSIKITGCAPMMAKPPCYVVDGDISKPFPQCCYKVRCKN